MCCSLDSVVFPLTQDRHFNDSKERYAAQLSHKEQEQEEEEEKVHGISSVGIPPGRLVSLDCSWWGNHSTRHKIAKQSRWIQHWCSLSGYRKELQRTALQPGEIPANGKGEEEEEECCLEKVQGIEVEEAEEEGRLVPINTNAEGTIRMLVNLLKACAREKNLQRGSNVHDDIVRMGVLEKNIVIGNTLVSMYAKCGSLGKAQGVFDNLPIRDVVSWSAIITGCAHHGRGNDALSYFECMQREGVRPDAFIFVSILKACGAIGAVDKGQEIHANVIRDGLVVKDVFIGNALVDMYVKCGLLARAVEVFDSLGIRNVVSWSALMGGYAEHGHGEQALGFFEQMQLEGHAPDGITYICILKACGIVGAVEKGQEIHIEIIRKGLQERHDALGNALVDMYVKCGLLAKAVGVFDKLLHRDVVSWNVLITGYTQDGHDEEALNCYDCMQFEGLSPDAVTCACVLKACGNVGAEWKGQRIHADIVGVGLLGKDIIVDHALVDMYAKCGMLAKAQEVFDQLPVQDVVLWSALITGYTLHGYGEEALNCFKRMQLEGFAPNEVTYICLLKACGSIGAVYKGQEIHDAIIKEGLLGIEIVISNALIDFYAKCGLLSEGQEVFDKLLLRDVVSWNVLITGYSLFGEVEFVFHSFKEMSGEGLVPNITTFTVILNACSRTGLLDKCKLYFENMTTCYGIIPTIEHHTCMVDLFCRAGQMDKVVEMIKEMPFSANLTVWHTVLGACQTSGNTKVGRVAFEHAVQLDEKDAASYVCMSNIYVDTERQDDADA